MNPRSLALTPGLLITVLLTGSLAEAAGSESVFSTPRFDRETFQSRLTTLKSDGLPSRYLPFDRDARFTRTLHVAVSGNGDGSPEAPLGSIALALSRATPGTKIVVQAGTYPALGLVDVPAGTQGMPIAIVGQGEVIIDGAGEPSSGIVVGQPRYLVLDNLTIRNTGRHGINFSDGGDYRTPGHHVVLRNLRFQDIGSGGNNDCVKFSGIDDFHIEYSEFSGCNRGEAIDLVGSHSGTILGNHFHDIPVNAVQAKGGSADIRIHANRFVNIGERAVNAGGSTGKNYFRPADATMEARGVRITSNLFLRTGSAVAAFLGCADCLFANNTVIEPRRFLIRVVKENRSAPHSREVQILNNVFVYRNAWLREKFFFDIRELPQISTVHIAANAWYALDPELRSVPGLGNVVVGAGNQYQVDPRFIDPGNGDYRPSASSPIVGAGLAVPDGVLSDFAGRAFAQPVTLGALLPPMQKR